MAAAEANVKMAPEATLMAAPLFTWQLLYTNHAHAPTVTIQHQTQTPHAGSRKREEVGSCDAALRGVYRHIAAVCGVEGAIHDEVVEAGNIGAVGASGGGAGGQGCTGLHNQLRSAGEIHLTCKDDDNDTK